MSGPSASLVQPCWRNTNESPKCFWKPLVTHGRKSNLPKLHTVWFGKTKDLSRSKWEVTDLLVLWKWWIIAWTRLAWVNLGWGMAVRTWVARIDETLYLMNYDSWNYWSFNASVKKEEKKKKQTKQKLAIILLNATNNKKKSKKKDLGY